MSFAGHPAASFSMTKIYFGLLCSVFTVVLTAGCQQSVKPQERVRQQRAPVVAPKVDENKITDAEANAFVKAFLSAIDKQSTTKLVELVDWDAIVNRIFKDQSTKSVFYKEYSAGGKKILGRFSKGIQSETGRGGNYDLLKIVRRGKDRHAIFRLVTGAASPAGGGLINYHNLRLIKQKGKVRADDIYIGRVGAWLSENYRSSLKPAILKSKESPVGFTSEQREQMEVYRLAAQMDRAARMGKYAESTELFQQLPEDVKKTKIVLTTRLLATNRDELFKAAEEMLAEYPGSPAVGLRLMDFGMKQRDLPALEQARELLAKWTGGDPYIDLNVATAKAKLGSLEEAIEMSQGIDISKFNFENPVFLKLNIALAAKDNVTLLECFRILRDKFDQDMKEFLKTEACQNFVESLEYLDYKND